MITELMTAGAGCLCLPLLAGMYCTGCGPRRAGDAPAHHARDGGFRNIVPGYEEKGLLDLLRWNLQRLRNGGPPRDYRFPPAEPDRGLVYGNGSPASVTWIGHATTLVRTAGRSLLTDPLFSRRASPVQWAGPERVVEPGLPLDELPHIDMVLISHDHYDALDERSIRRLHEREGGERTVFCVGLSLGHWFRDRGISNVVELDWWQSATVAGLEVTAVPAVHWSKRGIFGRNRNLWAGWVVESEELCFYFAGDSGYHDGLFREIGDRLGPFDLAAIPIGAYEPRWFMKDNHMSAAEAARVHLDVRSRRSMAIHWGTFVLTDEPLDEPPRMLREALDELDIPREQFVVASHGETVPLG